MLNLCYEWGCTSAVAGAPEGRGVRMMRTLDWPLDGLGRNVVVSRQTGAAGPWLNVTWPGFVGVTTALAPGRFAGALNQAPMAPHGVGRIGDWLINRWGIWFKGQIPPALLLRRAFEECADFAAAVRLLSETPICLPAIFTLAGIDRADGVVIERLEKPGLRPPGAGLRGQSLADPRAGRTAALGPQPRSARDDAGPHGGGGRRPLLAGGTDAQPDHPARRHRQRRDRPAHRPGLRAGQPGDFDPAPGRLTARMLSRVIAGVVRSQRLVSKRCVNRPTR